MVVRRSTASAFRSRNIPLQSNPVLSLGPTATCRGRSGGGRRSSDKRAAFRAVWGGGQGRRGPPRRPLNRREGLGAGDGAVAEAGRASPADGPATREWPPS